MSQSCLLYLSTERQLVLYKAPDCGTVNKEIAEAEAGIEGTSLIAATASSLDAAAGNPSHHVPFSQQCRLHDTM